MFNYDNIGGKIKGLAKAAFVVEAIAAVISGIGLMASDDDMILIGLLTMALGPFVAWVGSWLLYGFGELIEKAAEIELNTRGGERETKPQPQIDPQRLAKLNALRAQGLITEEEYQRSLSKEG